MIVSNLNELEKEELTDNLEIYMRMVTLLVQDVMKFNPRGAEREDEVVARYYEKAKEVTDTIYEKHKA